MRPEQKEEFKRNVGKLFTELKKKLSIKQSPKLFLVEDKDNADNQLGKTAYYDKDGKVIKLYITERHPKDILRSFAHEVIHHWQNENGALKSPSDNMSEQDPKYAQNDPVLRKAEKQAYLLGNIMFRDFEDNLKNK